jgi:serine O-acetyltransferase
MRTSIKPGTHVSAETLDWSREYKTFFSWMPSRSLLASIRSYQRHAQSSNILCRLLFKKVAIFRHRFWSVITGADIPLNCQIGGGLLLPHPNGIVIHPSVKVGPNCLIFQQVTIGTRSGQNPPVIGGHVDIGAGAKILGHLNIGDHVCIGANAVVLKDIPAGKSAVGIPAVIIERD